MGSQDSSASHHLKMTFLIQAAWPFGSSLLLSTFLVSSYVFHRERGSEAFHGNVKFGKAWKPVLSYKFSLHWMAALLKPSHLILSGEEGWFTVSFFPVRCHKFLCWGGCEVFHGGEGAHWLHWTSIDRLLSGWIRGLTQLPALSLGSPFLPSRSLSCHCLHLPPPHIPC